MPNEKTFNVRVLSKYATLEEWMTADPVLLEGEEAVVLVSEATDSKPAVVMTKFGDGVSNFSELPYSSAKQDAEGNNISATYATKSELSNKVDKVNGKGLSTNDYTTAEKNKLSGIEANANNYSHPASHPASMITGLADVATSGSYKDLSDTPAAVVVDSAINGSSTNPVQNKAVSAALGNKVDKVSGKGLSTNDYTTTEKNKLSGIAAGAEVNQNAFSKVVVGSTTVEADSKTDSLTIEAGSNVTVTADATNDKITISSAHPTISKYSDSTSTAAPSHGGTFTVVDSVTRDTNGHVTKVNTKTVTLPEDKDTTYGIATDDTLGLVKIGFPESGKNYPVELNSDNQMYVNVPWTDNNTTSFTITAGASDDDVVVLTGSNGTNGVSYTATHATKGPNTTTSTTKGATADVTISGSGKSGSIKVPKVTVDKYGHTTGLTEQTLSITMPTVPTVPSSLKNPNSLVIKGNGTVVETYDGSAEGEVNIKGAGSVSVTASDGVVTVTGATIPTLSSLGGVGSVTASGTAPLTLSASKSGTGVSITGSVDLSDYATKADISTAMVFKGSLGTGGTITALPTASSSTVGDTYKVIKDGTYASQAAKAGDVFVCSDEPAWVLIPSGDEPKGTVTSVTLKATSPIAIDSTSAITSSGTRTISHANSGATAGSYGDSAAQTPAYGGTFKVPYVTVNATGHVTGISEHTVKIPASDNTDTKVTAVGNHYTPAADSAAALSADASSTTPATWGSTDLVTGVNIQRDAKGHVTGVTVDSIQMPANPNTDNNTSHAHSAGVGLTVTGSGGTSGTTSYKAKLRSETALTVDSAAATTTSGRVYPVAIDKTGYLAVNVPWTNTDTDTHYSSKNTVGATNTNANAAKTNGNVYLNHIENGSATSTHKITGAGSVSVTSDASGNITITGTDTNTNYYHTPKYTSTPPSSPTGGSSNLNIGTGTGVNNMYVPVATASQAGVTIVYPSASCTTFSSDTGTVTPLAVQKGAKMFAITRPPKADTAKTVTNKAIVRWDGTSGDVQDSDIIIEDVTNSRDGSAAQVIAIPAAGGAKKMVYGYCTDQVDGTSFIGGLFDASATEYPYSSGLAIGGSSGNLLWKGTRVATTADLPTISSLGAVPTSRTINGKKLTGNITLTASDIGVTSIAITDIYNTGSGAPSASTGGKIYVDESTDIMYYKNSSGTWTQVASVWG